MPQFYKILLVGLLLTAASARSEDNIDLYACKTDSPEVAKALFQNDKTLSNVKQTVILVGQDKNPVTPLFEVRYAGLTADKKLVAGPITVRRVAFAKSPGGTASVTYAATRSNGKQNASVFNILIPPTLEAKMSFTQQNNRNAPTHPKFDLECEAKTADVRMPIAVELEKYTEDQQVALIRHLQSKLPNKNLYLGRDDDSDKRPTDVVADAEEKVATQINGLSMDVETLRKKLHVENSEAKVEWAPGSRCEKSEINSLRTVRDMTGKVIAYSGVFDCTNASIIVTYPAKDGEQPKPAKWKMGFNKVYVTSSRVMFTDAQIDLDRVYDKEE